MSIVPVDETRLVVFRATYTMNGKKESKDFSSRADLFSWVRGAEMFGVAPESIIRSVTQAVRIERPTAK